MIRSLIFLSLLFHSIIAQKPPETSSKWLTLNGGEPIVIARGGLSGVFPESSTFANELAISTGLTNVVVSCNLQLTKDGVGLCLPDVIIDNSTTVASIYPKAEKTYTVNGQQLTGFFTLDFTADQLLNNVTLTQNIFSRTSLFDGQLPIATIEDVTGLKPPQFWLSVQYDSFYTQNKISIATFVEQSSKRSIINYISSPEIGFLKAIGSKVNKLKTKLVFQVLGPDQIEPTTKTKYSAILGNLGTIKSYASGILVPKDYIWPVGKDGYLGSPTTLVVDAHKQGLEVYASGFSNDIQISYNYSYDPTSEYIQFIENSQFSVDGFLTDFSPTASEAIACFTKAATVETPNKGDVLVMSENGASGTYPGCTDLAYQKAVDDGVDIIDCSVQLSKDGIPFCLASPDISGETTAMMPFIDRKETIPEIQPDGGIFSFALTWDEIQTLKPQIASPYANTSILRNPAEKNSGKFMTLADFLDFAKAKAVSGILINIENAAYLASKQGLDLVGSVLAALTKAAFDTQSTQKVLIESDDTSVLTKFKEVPSYKRVLRIKEKFGDAPKPSVDEIKKYADAVTLPRSAIVRVSEFFTIGMTNVVKELKAANLSVYVHKLSNEYVTLAFDYFSDPIVEIATYVQSVGIDGFFTEFPATAHKYFRSKCINSDPKALVPYPILPTEAGSLLSLIPPEIQPPAPAPEAPLEIADIIDPPLPEVSKVNHSEAAGMPKSSPSGALENVANVGFSLVVIVLLLGFFSFGC